MAGEVVHVEFPSGDADRAQAFWSGLFGWEFVNPGMPEMDYRMAQVSENAGVAVFASGEPHRLPHDLSRHREHRRVDRPGARARRRGR